MYVCFSSLQKYHTLPPTFSSSIISTPFLCTANFSVKLKMSQIHEQAPKHCAQKQALTLHKLKKKLLLLFYFPALFFFAVLFLVLFVWLILRPSKPQFSLQQANLTTAPSSAHNSTSLHLTLISHNPNRRVGIYYHQFLLHAFYKGQNITPDASIDPFYQGHLETNPLSAVLDLVGHQHKRNGNMVLTLKVSGRLRWKVGTWVSGKYRFSVDCVSMATFGTTLRVPPMSSKEGTKCSTWM